VFYSSPVGVAQSHANAADPSRSAEEDSEPEVRLNFAPHSGKQLLF